MMPGYGHRRLGGQWLQAYVWIPPHLNNAPAAAEPQNVETSEDRLYETTIFNLVNVKINVMLKNSFHR